LWRCDDRSPEVLRDQDLDARNAGGLVWRSGGDCDDVDGQTAVCLSKTIEGAIFFPFHPQTGTTTYLYAVKLTQGYFDSERAQTNVHRLINPHDTGVQGSYYPYDPQELEEHGWISPRWLYGEVVTDSVPWDNIVGCWALERDFLLPAQDNSKPGVSINSKKVVGKKAIEEKSDEAQKLVDAFYNGQKDREYYSYAGIIKLKGEQPRDAADAERYFYDSAALGAHSGVPGLGGKKGFLTLTSRSPFADAFEYRHR
jgi:hypothetical protein